MKTQNPIRYQFLGLFTLFIIVSIGVSAIIGIQQMSKAVMETFSTAGIFTVEKAASLVDGDSFETLALSLDKDDPFYEETRVKLFQLKEFSGSEYLYTMAPANGSIWHFIIDGSSTPDDTARFSALGDTEDTKNYNEAFNRVLQSGKTEVGDLEYQDRWGWLVSIYTPIVSSAGKIVGIAGCDFNGTNLHNAIMLEKIMLIIIGAISLITGALLLILFFNLQKKVEEKTQRITELHDTLLKTMAEMLNRRDDITGGHIERTQRGAKILLEEMERSGIYQEETKDWDLDLLLQSCQLHDVGKISISDDILKKPGRFNEAEFKEMQQHSALGEQIIEKIETMEKESDFLKYAKIFAASHHEKWNGTGYPQRLKGKEIPLLGRIMAIVDVYDALVSYRPYKNAFPHETAVKIISDGKGTHFDPVLVDLFLKVSDKFRQIV